MTDELMDTQFGGDVKQPGIAKMMQFGAKAEGDQVKMTFGNITVAMDYKDALQFSQWVRMAAKQAKTNAGDQGRIVNVLGVLDDANAG